jgi:hypothetical protein
MSKVEMVGAVDATRQETQREILPTKVRTGTPNTAMSRVTETTETMVAANLQSVKGEVGATIPRAIMAMMGATKRSQTNQTSQGKANRR